MKKLLFILLILGVLTAAALGVYLQLELNKPAQAVSGVLVDVPNGSGAREIVGLLEQRNVIENRNVALAYIFYTGNRHKLQAGEYLFDKPLTIPEVVDRLVRGAVYLHRFTVPEGLTLEQTARKWEEQGFGKAEEFEAAAEGALEKVRTIDDRAVSVEGYLFPETYSFPTRTTASQVVNAMIGRFRETVARLEQTVPASDWPRKLHDTVVLASLVETEAAHADERPVIASVYLNRLTRNILLQCDPTVIYALQRAGKYRGTLTLADLKFQSPYNTYVSGGLPPGPIANPGYASLLAAIQPASTNYLFFVRTTEGRHTFSEDLAGHNRAVAAYRKMRNRS
jgi:UPF0755 protein